MTTYESDGLIVFDRSVSDDGQAKRRAVPDALEGRAASVEAEALVQHVFEQVQSLDTRQRKGEKRFKTLKCGIEAFLSALLLPQDSNSKIPFVAIATGRDAFTGREVSAKTFQRVRNAFEQNSWVNTSPGFATTWWYGRGGYTRFEATESLLELSRQFGVEPSEASKHFKAGLPYDPLALKAKKPKGNPEAGRILKIPAHLEESSVALREGVRALNNFLDKQELSNCIHYGYIRAFNCGDMPEFNWNMGGRLYSQGPGNYQQRPESERLKILINGEAVCDLDFRASYLTIFHAIHGEQLPLDSDPYRVAGLTDDKRAAAKRWMTVSFGQGKLLTQWSSRMLKEADADGLKLREHPVSEIKKALLSSYPLLAKIENDPDPKPLWARLMFTESHVIMETMKALMAEGIPSLSMHDGLIVPQNRQARAEGSLKATFKRLTGCEVAVSISTGQIA